MATHKEFLCHQIIGEMSLLRTKGTKSVRKKNK